MKYKVTFFGFFVLLVQAVAGCFEVEERIDLGRFTKGDLVRIIQEASNYGSTSEKIDFISSQFIGMPYKEGTLVGDEEAREILTINLAWLDCFTYLDYVEALRLSSRYEEIKGNLIRVRYKEGEISYKSRKHFFSDWTDSDSNRIKDMTQAVGGVTTISVKKFLNKKADGTRYMAGIPVVARIITYIPSDEINQSVTTKLKAGDYVSAYSHKAGLDVSHTGIVIKKDNTLYLRHASSRKENRRVVDEKLLSYFKSKPGMIVYRAL